MKAFQKKSIVNDLVNVATPVLMKNSFMQSTLRSAGRSLKIYVYYKGDYITDRILSSGTWEPHLMVHFEAYIKTHPGIQVLDVGCNIGVYTLTAAALGCRVVSVDANPDNTDRVVQSLIANGIQNKTTICLNAISNVRRRFVINVVPSNIGGSGVKEVANNTNKSVQSIFMDDLIPYFDKEKEVLLKIDIEGNEINAFRQASKFFDQRNVTFVMMEWEHIKKMKDIHYLIDFFISRHFTPCTNFQKTQILNVANFISWPYDIFWIK